MKDLDAINPRFAKPSSICSIAAVIPFLSSAGGIALAGGAAPEVPFSENPLSILSAVCMVASFIFFFVPRIFKWSWEAKYFGVGLLYLASAAFGMIPWLCIGLYSTLPISLRVLLLIIYVTIMFRWCYRFVLLYRDIYGNKKMRNCVYEEEVDAVYYLQKGDTRLLEKLKFMQYPGGMKFVGAWLLAFSIVPFMAQATAIVGLPFTHILVAIGSLPIDMTMFGLATRGWLIYYYYPRKIWHETGKTVYVDMASKPAGI